MKTQTALSNKEIKKYPFQLYIDATCLVLDVEYLELRKKENDYCICLIENKHEKAMAYATIITQAVNNTYGKNLNPAVMEEAINRLQKTQERINALTRDLQNDLEDNPENESVIEILIDIELGILATLQKTKIN